jgi:hypothetical protein
LIVVVVFAGDVMSKLSDSNFVSGPQPANVLRNTPPLEAALVSWNPVMSL